MKLNIQKIRNNLLLSIWEYEIDSYVDLDTHAVVKFVDDLTDRNITIPTADVEHFVDEHKEQIIEGYDPDSGIDINQYAATVIADDVAQILSQAEFTVTFKINLPCKSHV